MQGLPFKVIYFIVILIDLDFLEKVEQKMQCFPFSFLVQIKSMRVSLKV